MSATITSPSASRSAPPSTDERLDGPWLVIARLVAAGIVAFALLVCVVGGQATIVQMLAVCERACAAPLVSVAQLRMLHQLGISLETYVILTVSFMGLITLVWFGAAALVFWRRSDTFFLLLLATQLVTQGAANVVGAPLSAPWDGLTALLITINQVLFFLFLALFPTGRFAPRWIAWLMVPAGIALVAEAIPGSPDLLSLTFPVAFTVLLLAQVYRYRAVSTSVQRQQTKWVILGLGITFPVEFVVHVVPAVLPGLVAPDTLYPLVSPLIVNLAFVLAVIAFVIAILRYRLYDIDVLINRTLVYGSLSAILVAVYFAVVYGAQALLNTFVPAQAGRDSPVLIVASTLLIAALFTPLRQRIQATVDRRFYRRKYDAAKTLAAFGATLRNEVDLSDLKERLVDIVDETMQPKSVSLWLSTFSRAPRESGSGPLRGDQPPYGGHT